MCEALRPIFRPRLFGMNAFDLAVGLAAGFGFGLEHWVKALIFIAVCSLVSTIMEALYA